MIETLTGRTRLRLQNRIFRRAVYVQQVEVVEDGYEHDWTGGARRVRRKFWRDATLEDITTKAKQ